MVKIKKCCHAGIDYEDDISTATTISTIRSTERLEFLALNRDTTISSVTGRGIESYAIYK
jgi:hypothetical protein